MIYSSAPPLRSALYLPASNPRAIEKARTLSADAVIFDLEDAVAPGEKPEARRNLQEAFAGGKVAAQVNVIRTNAHASAEFAADLALIRTCRPDAILVPKVSTQEEILAIRRDLDLAFGDEPPSLWCMIETARSVLLLPEIASVRRGPMPLVDCLVIGTNDLARETGVSMAQGRQFMTPWLMAAVLAAKANGIAILDGVWNDFRNTDGFDAEAEQGRLMGFDGKTLIHPTQVDAANRIFAPAPEALEEAREIVGAFAEPGNAGKGVINLGGRMVELLHLDMAQQLLRKHEAICLRS